MIDLINENYQIVSEIKILLLQKNDMLLIYSRKLVLPLPPLRTYYVRKEYMTYDI